MVGSSAAGEYRVAALAAAGVALLFMVQTLVNMVVRLRARHPGGIPIPADPQQLLFRVDRARANTTEVLGVFVLALFLAAWQRAPATMVNVGAVLFFAGRLSHMLCYYVHRPRTRSLSFLLGNIGIIIVIVAVFRKLAAL